MPKLMLGGLIVCGVAGAGLAGMTAILSWWLVRILGPAVLILVGFGLLVWGMVHPRHLSHPPR